MQLEGRLVLDCMWFGGRNYLSTGENNNMMILEDKLPFGLVIQGEYMRNNKKELLAIA
jgi:hypothetical protein